jgi:Tol biopolymer transport system component
MFQFGLICGLLAMLTLPVAVQAQSNGKIVFKRGTGFWVMDADGSNPARIDSEFLDRVNNNDPVWSPDGTQIAFSSDTGTTTAPQIYVINADGTNVIRLTNDIFSNIEPAWSPDGTKIAFAANRDGLIGSIYTMDADGGNITRVTNAFPASDQAPAWSPDGTQIAFWTNEGAIGLHIAIVNADGTGRTGLAPNTAFGRNPAWSPDGTQIVYGNPQIVVMNTDGTNQRNLSGSSFNDDHPAWSPDGTQIAFERNVGGQIQIFIINADGTGETNLTGTAGGSSPDWCCRLGGVVPAAAEIQRLLGGWERRGTLDQAGAALKVR